MKRLTALTIGETADLLGMTPKAIRHYHRIGLVDEPPRTESGYRLYDADTIGRLRMIQQLGRIGLSLRQIKFVLDSQEPDRVLASLLHDRQQSLERELARLRDQRAEIQALLATDSPLSSLSRSASETDSTAILFESVKPLSRELAAVVTASEAAALSELDRIAWSAGYGAFWETVGLRLAASARPHISPLILWLERYLALADLEPGDQQAAAWLREFQGSPARSLLAQTLRLPESDALDAVEQARIERVFPLLLFKRGTALQREFLCLLNPQFRSDEL
jgi:DNA-binding transcriptional MerR regulator